MFGLTFHGDVGEERGGVSVTSGPEERKKVGRTVTAEGGSERGHIPARPLEEERPRERAPEAVAAGPAPPAPPRGACAGCADAPRSVPIVRALVRAWETGTVVAFWNGGLFSRTVPLRAEWANPHPPVFLPLEMTVSSRAGFYFILFFCGGGNEMFNLAHEFFSYIKHSCYQECFMLLFFFFFGVVLF